MNTRDTAPHTSLPHQPSRWLAVLMAAMLACTASLAAKPEWAGNGNGKDKGNPHMQGESPEHGDDHGGK